MSGVIQICLSVWVIRFYVCLVYGKSSLSRLCVVMWGVEGGGGLIVLCRCGTVCKQIKAHTLWLQEGCQNWLAGSVSIEEFMALLALLAREWDRWVVRSKRGFGLPGDCSEMSLPFL